MRRHLAVFAAVFLLVLVAATARPVGVRARQEATPAPSTACDGMTPTAETPMAGMDHGGTTETPMAGMNHGGMAMGSPMAGMETEFDQAYIDMMIPHHASIVAMADAALSRLEDERLREIARTIVGTQTAEIEELRGYRQRFYGAAEPMPMDEPMMGAMMEMMPGMDSMEEMAFQMDAAAQVAAICAADDPDRAFIDLTIPHHESAIAASEAALDQAAQDEIRAFAAQVIEEQRREIDELGAIRHELHGSARPDAVAR